MLMMLVILVMRDGMVPKFSHGRLFHIILSLLAPGDNYRPEGLLVILDRLGFESGKATALSTDFPSVKVSKSEFSPFAWVGQNRNSKDR